MVSFDGEETCELINTHLLHELGKIINKNNIGLYMDNSLIILRNSKGQKKQTKPEKWSNI